MNFDINIIRAEIEDWAVEQGQEHVAIEISRAYLRLVINQEHGRLHAKRVRQTGKQSIITGNRYSVGYVVILAHLKEKLLS